MLGEWPLEVGCAVSVAVGYDSYWRSLDGGVASATSVADAAVLLGYTQPHHVTGAIRGRSPAPHQLPVLAPLDGGR